MNTLVETGQNIGDRRLTRSLKWSFVLLCVAVASLVAGEILARLLVGQRSRIEQRIVQEYKGIFAPQGEKPAMLFLGNSLLEAGVDFPQVRQTLASHADARRFVIENTAYYDWYYGMRRIFHEGAKPRVVVLMLSELQFVSSSSRGEYSAYRLMRTADVPDAAMAMHLHPTEATGLLTASVSGFYGLRSEVRKFVLAQIMPSVSKLTEALGNRPGETLSDDVFFARARPRLLALRSLMEQHGYRLILLMPPLRDDPSRLMRAAREAGIAAVRPFSNGEFQPEHFRDPMHVNETGRAIYTKRLLQTLKSDPAFTVQ